MHAFPEDSISLSLVTINGCYIYIVFIEMVYIANNITISKYIRPGV